MSQDMKMLSGRARTQIQTASLKVLLFFQWFSNLAVQQNHLGVGMLVKTQMPGPHDGPEESKCGEGNLRNYTLKSSPESSMQVVCWLSRPINGNLRCDLGATSIRTTWI